MKTSVAYLCCLLIIGWLGTAPTALAQGGGCAARPDFSIILEEPVVEVIPILAAVAETQAGQARGVFAREAVAVTYAPGQQVWLASHVEGQQLAGVCSDDLAMIRAYPVGKTWEQDFRSRDRTTIVSRPAVNITDLFIPGVNQVALSVTDLVSPGASSSAYVIVIAGNPVTPTAVPTTTAAAPTSPPPTRTPTATLVISKSLVLEVVTDTEVNPPIITAGGETASPTRRPLWWVGGLAALGMGLLFLGWRRRARRLSLPGQITLFENGQMLEMWDLGSLGKAEISLGGTSADVVLPGKAVPAVVARIVAQATAGGRTQAIWQLLDPDDPSVILERQSLEHGDEVRVFETIWLEYSHYEERSEPTFLEGELSHV